MQAKDCVAGESWACRFRVTTFLDDQGCPVEASVSVGQAHPGVPGEYTGIGIVKTRDCANELVELEDCATHRTWVVEWSNTWDYDRVEWID